MKLIDILVRELPKRGGWPEGVYSISQFPSGELCYHDEENNCSNANTSIYLTKHEDGDDTDWAYGIYITREQYESALAAKNDGWIEWGGGKCPLHHGAIVDVKLRNGRTEYAQEALSIEGYASYPFWRKDDTSGDIIAYRLHKPQQEEHPEAREEDINDCIGQAPAPIWNGEGLPPVGCECEAKFRYRNSAEWMYFRCVAVDCDVAFGWAGKDAVALEWESYQFRPIRSEAERKRDESLRVIYEILDAGTSTKQDATGIYDAIAAGKIPGVKLED